MPALAGLLRFAGRVSSEDEAALARARDALPALGAVPAVRGDGWMAYGGPVVLDSNHAPTLSRDPSGLGVLYVASFDGGVLWASEVRALWATGLVPRRIDRTGIAGVLWRGAALDARLPAAGIRAVRPGETWLLTPQGPVVSRSRATPPVPSSPEDVRAVIVDRVRASGAKTLLLSGDVASAALVPIAGKAGLDVHALRPDSASVAEALARVLDGDVDLPSVFTVDAEAVSRMLEGRAGTLLAGLGGDALFGAGPLFSAWDRARGRAWPRLRRPGAGGDPMDVEAQREREFDAFREIPVNWIHSYLAALPAATREAISTVGPRPADGLMPQGAGIEIVSDVVRRGVVVEGILRATEAAGRAHGIEWAFPFLAEDVVSAALALPSRERFGRPGSGGLLPRWGARKGSGARHDGGAALEGALDAALRGALRDRLEAALSRERVAAQGLLRADAVADALARWRSLDGGWTSRRILLLAAITSWVERHALRCGGD